MKKIISILASLSLFMNMSTSTVFAVDDNEASLKELAISLGSETDHLNIPNFVFGSEERQFPMDSYLYWYNNANNYEKKISPMYVYGRVLGRGSCLGISILEILTHNGVIKPSDISSNAENLSDIVYTKEIGDIIATYQALQGHIEYDMYERYLMANFTKEQQAERLIELAEKNMKENKYFLITFYSTKIGHAVVGMGITDGQWEFNGQTYDKCILTLDSNVVNQSGNSVPFNEGTCIYVNTENMQSCIPKYELYSYMDDKNDTLLISSIDDDTLLNYKGMINPSEKIETDISTLNLITLREGSLEYKCSYTDKDGSVHELEEPQNEFGSLNYLDYFVDAADFSFEGYDKGVSDTSKKIRIKNQKYDLGFTNKNRGFYFDIKDDKFTIKSRDNQSIDYYMHIYYNEEYYPCSPHYYWTFGGNTDGTVNITPVKEGMLLSSDSKIEMAITTDDHESIKGYDDNGDPLSSTAHLNTLKVTSVVPVMISFDEESKPLLYVDPDKDGVYDTPIQKGDVDCNGIVDERDATSVLRAATLKNAGKSTFLNEDIADFNNDGIADARDATSILKYSVEMSAK